ncbi:MAG TPA: EamA family transporter RarD [Mycobacteriales bacterium]|nr:EamA family transporter RarD [Mycobacteriales bacterium]
MTQERSADERQGVGYGAAAYLLWGLFPIYWPLLKPAGALEILAHRMLWSFVVVIGIVIVQRRWGRILELVRSPRRLLLLAAAAALVSVNWGTYIWGVNHDHVVETSLGYFINPLVTALLGVIVLRERLRPIQWAALAFGAAAIAVITIDYGRLPWIALTLAGSFGTYGLIKKHLSASAVDSFVVESSVQAVPAAIYIGFLAGQGDSNFGNHGAGHALLIAASGVVTTIPLLCFGEAARRLRLTVLGMLQYLAPILQFGFGVLLFHESMSAARLIGFILVWIGLIVLTADAVRHGRRRRMRAPDPVTPETAAALGAE